MYSLEEITQIALGDSEKKACCGVELCCFYFVYGRLDQPIYGELIRDENRKAKSNVKEKIVTDETVAMQESEGDADSGYILTMEDGAEESRSGVDSHLSFVPHSEKDITQATGVELLLVVHGDGGL